MKLLSEKSLIPIGTAVLVFGGGATWMTKISVVQDAQAAKIEKSDIRADYYIKSLQEIRERLIRIEEKVSKGK